ncbi:threonine--tRNA ligase [Oceanotoga sp. DSM 15011]|jgi:threonyl-tRNA synthetase|uniref:Threonine--tRNA ligase n=1 Tax=Oceanotoga teriensis TaxID=515440 RepID=A0AA45HJC8_9BACT|nr:MULTISPECIES: threonine--tRNA ligase [Oceanotoga]MDN5342437.1 threonyl-tRNA synthetase [Oceanotoga sp.]MDO7975610.1 threonine--tRNA ligase [Oceanotoga teriensis]PWJ96101.1 threonyl-tRNA synthetase [Oceanotoga teriensis]UYO99883.1 threonine--tRNA ligase [Oceanotoga sp. DSM 15011]
MVKIKLPDGSIKEFEIGIKASEIAKSISEGLFRNSIGAKINGELKDLDTAIEEDSEVSIITLKDDDAPKIYRHTVAHIMAQAVMRIYDNVKVAIGPTIENGFYYDFDLEEKISEDDFEKIESEMKKIVKEDIPIKRSIVSKDSAKELFKDQPYKLELIDSINDENVSIYKQGDFIDLCRGPHMPSTKFIKHFKLLSVSGAYWKGDENNKMLQRIYATAFTKKNELDEHLHLLEEAKKRDHRKLGPQLGLFTIDTDVAPGMPFFLERGTIALNEMKQVSREIHEKYGYFEVETPQIMNVNLWHQSGHWDHYQDNMFFTEKEDTEMAVKPMNCPGHIVIYNKDIKSYRDLPIRMFEFGKVHRYERSGVLHGLFRVRVFTQDDAHIFCTKDQIQDELIGVMDLIDELYSVFGFEYEAKLSTMPEDHMGDVETWDLAISALRTALEKSNTKFQINEGDGAFYGPKIDFYVTDSLGRKWQCATLQLDFQMPERFNMTYVNPDNEEIRPVMLHRAIFGSIERFFGILIESFAGAFPTWMSPEQVSIISVSEKYNDGATKFAKELKKHGIRVSLNISDSTVGYKIREEQMKKIPYMIVFGEKELSSDFINIRTRENNNVDNIKVEDFINTLKDEIKSRKLKLSY